MSAVAFGTRRGYLGFGGWARVTGFVLGVVGIVVGALVLADGILEYATVSGMPSYLNVATDLFGNRVWWTDVAIGAVLVGVGAVLGFVSRYVRW